MPDEPVGRVRGEPDGGRDRHDGLARPCAGEVPGRRLLYGHADIATNRFFFVFVEVAEMEAAIMSAVTTPRKDFGRARAYGAGAV